MGTKTQPQPSIGLIAWLVAVGIGTMGGGRCIGLRLNADRPVRSAARARQHSRLGR
jgi:hypothetical protein